MNDRTIEERNKLLERALKVADNALADAYKEACSCCESDDHVKDHCERARKTIALILSEEPNRVVWRSDVEGEDEL